MILPAALLAAALSLADLPPDLAGKLAEGAPAASTPEFLAKVLDAGGAHRVDTGAVYVDTDARWYAAVAGSEPGSPLLDLRRWPGDTAVVVYLLEASAPLAPPAWEDARWSPDGDRRWRGVPAIDGTAREALWIDRPVSGSTRRLGILVLPGDAGLGRQARGSIGAEAAFVAARLVARPEPLSKLDPEATPLPPSLAWRAGEGDESTEAWRSYAGPGFTLALPPGIGARRLDLGPPSPDGVEGRSLWIRGRLRDRDGKDLALGDARRAGHVAIRSPGDGPPLGLESGRRVDAVPLDPYLLEDVAASEGSVEHWEEPGFDGAWIVFRLAYDDRRVELALPVTGDWRSLALFQIVSTFRPAPMPPAPLPIDPSGRLGMAFDRFRGGEKKRQPLLEGVFSAPGLRMAIPRGLVPYTRLSGDGFPVSIARSDGTPVATVRRVVSADLAGEIAGGRWAPDPRAVGGAVRAAYRRDDGARLQVGRDGTGFALEPASESDAGSLWTLLTDGFELTVPAPSR